MAAGETSILDLLEEAEWDKPLGRTAVASPYLPFIKVSMQNVDPETKKPRGFDPKTKLGKSFKFKVNTGLVKEQQDAELRKHLAQLRKAAATVEGGPVTVLITNDDIDRKTGEVTIQFVTREKITRERPAAEPVAATA